MKKIQKIIYIIKTLNNNNNNYDKDLTRNNVLPRVGSSELSRSDSSVLPLRLYISELHCDTSHASAGAALSRPAGTDMHPVECRPGTGFHRMCLGIIPERHQVCLWAEASGKRTVLMTLKCDRVAGPRCNPAHWTTRKDKEQKHFKGYWEQWARLLLLLLTEAHFIHQRTKRERTNPGILELLLDLMCRAKYYDRKLAKVRYTSCYLSRDL